MRVMVVCAVWVCALAMAPVWAVSFSYTAELYSKFTLIALGQAFSR
jgi:hypothetical protein